MPNPNGAVAMIHTIQWMDGEFLLHSVSLEHILQVIGKERGSGSQDYGHDLTLCGCVMLGEEMSLRLSETYVSSVHLDSVRS